MKKYVLAIDQGTTSSRAILFDAEQNVIKVSQKEITNSFPEPGWVEQDAEEIFGSVLTCIDAIFKDGDVDPCEVASIGITNQRETTIVWNRHTGKPVYPAIVWQSRQTNEIVDRYKQAGVQPLIHEKTGLVLDPYFSATKIRFILEHVDDDPEDLYFGTVDTWLAWKLTKGKKHITDVTNASRTMLMDLSTCAWDQELLELFDIPEGMLPEITDTSGMLAEIDPSYFKGCSCPIGAMVGDQQSALFGQSCFEAGDVKNTYGTGGFLLLNTGKRPIVSEHGLLTTVAWRIGDQINYALEGSIFVSGSLIQWMRDSLHFFERSEDSEKLANEVSSCNGVIIVPSFTGLGAPYWNEKCTGAIYGLTRGTDPRHLVRAALESMAFQSKDLIQVMEEELRQKIRYLKVDGGASENRFLNQFQSDILEIPVHRNVMRESTALGAARLAGLAVGFYQRESFRDFEKEVFMPQRGHEEVEKLYARWKQAVKATQLFAGED